MKNTNWHIFRIAPLSVLASIFLLSMALPAQATISRVNSLGGCGDYMEDDSNVLHWYGSLADYPNQAVLESGNFNIPDGYWHSPSEKSGGPGFGAHLALGQDGHFGTAALFYHDQDEDRTTTLTQDHLRNNLSLLYSLDLGIFTAAATYRHGSLSTEELNATTELSIDTFGTGLRMDLGPSAYLDLAGEIRRVHEDRSGDPDFEESEDDGLLALRARAFVGLSPRIALIPVLELIDETRQVGYLNRTTHDNNLKRFGLGLNYFPDTDHLLLCSAEYSNYDQVLHLNNYQLNDWSSFIVKVGFESRMLSWLTTRGSVGLVKYGLDMDINAGAIPEEGDDFEGPILRVNLGASIHLGAVDLDFAFWEKTPEAYNLVQDLESDERLVSITARLLF